jgi:antitoxin HigA-1
MRTPKKLAPVHPGEILLEEFMKPLGLSQNRLGRDLGVPPRRINEIVHGKRSVTADTALRLSRYFGTSAEFWLGLQADYDLDTASDRLAERIAREVKVFAPSAEAQEIPRS